MCEKMCTPDQRISEYPFNRRDTVGVLQFEYMHKLLNGSGILDLTLQHSFRGTMVDRHTSHWTS